MTTLQPEYIENAKVHNKRQFDIKGNSRLPLHKGKFTNGQ